MSTHETIASGEAEIERLNARITQLEREADQMDELQSSAYELLEVRAKAIEGLKMLVERESKEVLRLRQGIIDAMAYVDDYNDYGVKHQDMNAQLQSILDALKTQESEAKP